MRRWFFDIVRQDTHHQWGASERADPNWYSQGAVTSFLFYDFETDGAEPSICRPSQFAAIRTDEQLNPIEDEATTTWCQPPRDRLPAPEACLVTGITPQMAAARGHTEATFFGDIHRRFNASGTISLGWNTTRFDDTVSRFGFWRNFLDPYEHTYKNNCGTWDLIDLARAARALRPEGLNWPVREDGAPSFRLEDLTAANGIEHGDAHDAMADVKATIDIAARLLEHQPDLWNWARSLIDTQKVEGILKSDLPFVHTSSRVPAQLGCTSPFRMLAPHPVNKRSFICWDLREDPSELLDADPEEIMRRTFSPASTLGDQRRFALKEIKSNKAPFLAPTGVLKSGDHDLLQLDEDQWRAHDSMLMKDRSIIQTIRARLQEAWQPLEQATTDAAEALYDGFPSGSDIRLRNKVPDTDRSKLAGIGERFEDPRLQSLMLQYRAKEAPDTLDAAEQQCCIQRCRQRLLDPPGKSSLSWPAWLKHVRELIEDPSRSIDQVTILKSVETWGIELADSIGLPVPAAGHED